MDVTAACNYAPMPDGTHVAEPCYSVRDGEDVQAAVAELERILDGLRRRRGVISVEVADVDTACGLVFVRVHTRTSPAMATVLRDLSAMGCCTGMG